MKSYSEINEMEIQDMKERAITSFSISAFWDETSEGIENDPISITDIATPEELQKRIDAEIDSTLEWHASKPPASLMISYLDSDRMCIDNETIYL